MSNKWLLCFIEIGLFCHTAWANIAINLIKLFYESKSNSSIYNLYTRKNPDTGYELAAWNVENLLRSPFEAGNPVKVIIHGYNDYPEFGMVYLKDNYLKVGNYNVILVDWRLLASDHYFDAAEGTEKVGRDLSELLKFLKREKNLSFSDVHILGHSLGSYIAGYAGYWLSGQVGRITAMDPASPRFCFTCPEPKLKENTAAFIDVIHTCTDWYGPGTKDPLGHVDFYPNGGECVQPGCLPILDLSQYSQNQTASCGHAKSYKYMSESILYPKEFLAVKCNDWEEYKTGSCQNESTAFMGEHVSPNVRGQYFLETNGDPPYGKAFSESNPMSKKFSGQSSASANCFTKKYGSVNVVFISMN